MSDKTYNGWSNYETWLVALWVDNEEWSYKHWRNEAESILEDEEGDKESAARILADNLKNEIGESKPEVSGFYADLINSALCEVNWNEIAENWLADIEYEVEEDEEDEEDDEDC